MNCPLKTDPGFEPHQRAHSPQLAARLASEIEMIITLRGKIPCSLLQGMLQF